MKKKIVIIGAGFGGIYTFLGLRKHLKNHDVEVLLINKTNYFLFSPLLHEAASGGTSPLNVGESVREIIRDHNANLLIADATAVDFDKKIIQTNQGEIEYDTVVMATGASTNYYGIKGAQKYTFELKTVADAVRIHDHIIDIFEAASHINDPKIRHPKLRFAVVGGGATGVELSAELAELLFETFEKLYKNACCPKDAHIYLINSGVEVLPRFHPFFRRKAAERLTMLNIDVKFNCKVTEVTEKGMVLDTGETIDVETIIWVAGVKASLPSVDKKFITERSGRIIVNKHLQIDNDSSQYALGDAARVMDNDDHELPMFAQIAVQEASVVAHNIIATHENRPLKEFVYHSQGDLLSLGKGKALGNIHGVKVSGFLIWFLWRTVYLFKYASWRKRIKIVVDWTLNLFYPRDIARWE